MAFKTSVNIKFDLGNKEFINRYLPTPSHAEVLKGLLSGFLGESRAHIIIGAYGTGKSLVATVVNGIASKLFSEEDIEQLAKKFDQVDDSIANQIRKAGKINLRYLPILLTGNEGRFRQSVLSKIVKALAKEGIEVILPGASQKIIGTIDKWRESYPSTYSLFMDMLERDSKEFDNWIKEIINQNESEIAYFGDLYKDMTSGVEFESDYNYNFEIQMDYITQVLEQNDLGIQIVYDEFGRFLNGLSPSRLNETMEDIQNLAELADRTKYLQFILITHKSLRQYFGLFNEEAAKEFQKIEERFKQYFIKSDQLTFLRIAESILAENNNINIMSKENKSGEIIENLRKFPLFPSLNQTERERLISESLFPLHPVTLYLLPNLSSVFGQNERTLFTFLESNDTGGLLEHISTNKSYYKPNQLFDYFFQNTSDAEIDDQISEHFLLYRKALARVPSELENKGLGVNILKFISLWNLCGLQSEQKLSNEFLYFAMQEDIEEVDRVINTLSEHKVIRFDRISGYWVVFAGSSVNIPGRLEKDKKEFLVSKDIVLKTLYDNLAKKYYYPEIYNDQKGMTRFAKIDLLFGDELSEARIVNDIDADLIIHYIIPEDGKAIEGIIENLKKYSHIDKSLFALQTLSFEKIKEKIIESAILEKYLKDKELISEDKGVQKEIELMLEEASFLVRKYLNKLDEFDDVIKWFIGGNEVKINNEFDLSNFLTKKCESLYNMTPSILNDSFNKKNISGQQKKAAIKVIDALIDNYKAPQFNIEGKDADYAIFASIFKNNGNLNDNISRLDYQNIKYNPYRLIRSELIETLDKDNKGNFGKVIDIFQKSPYGIRKPVIPILLVALLRDRWNELMLYKNDMYVPALNGEKLYKIIVEGNPESYNYTYEHIDEEYISFFNAIEDIFSDYLETNLEGKSRLLITCSTLIKWLRSLPLITQLSDNVIEEFSWLRNWIRKTEVNPQLSIETLFNKYGNDYLKLKDLKQYAEESFLLNLKSGLVNKVYDVTGANNQTELEQWALSQSDFSKKNNKLVKALLDSSYTDGWIDYFTEAYIGVNITNWSDTTLSLFTNELINDVEKLRTISENVEPIENKEYVSIVVGDRKKVALKAPLSVKATKIHENIVRMLEVGGKNVTSDEIEHIVIKLLDQFVS